MSPEPKIMRTEISTLAVGAQAYTVETEIWDYATPTYHVYDAEGECLSAEDAFEHYPSADEVRELLPWTVSEGSEGLFYLERGVDRIGPYPHDEAHAEADKLNRTEAP